MRSHRMLVVAVSRCICTHKFYHVHLNYLSFLTRIMLIILACKLVFGVCATHWITCTGVCVCVCTDTLPSMHVLKCPFPPFHACFVFQGQGRRLEPGLG